MTLRFLTTCILFAGLSSLPCTNSSAQQSDQSIATFSYEVFDDSFARRFDLRKTNLSGVEPPSSAVYFNSQSDWLSIAEADYSKPGPWITQVDIVSAYGSLQLSLIDHATYSPSVTWVTEKLLLVQVWWGRIVGTVALLDLSNNSWVYREMFYPAELVNHISPRPDLLASITAGDPLSISIIARSIPDSTTLGSVRINLALGEIDYVGQSKSCSSTIESPEALALRQAIIAVEENRREKNAPCKPGPCRDCTLYTVVVETGSGAQGTYSQQSSCLSTDPFIQRLVMLVDAIGANHLSRCYSPLLKSTGDKNRR